MEHIYKEMKKRGIELYPYRKEIYDKTMECYILPLDIISKMSDENFKKYLDALYCIHNENAGGYNGWATAFKKLEELGFKKKEFSKGHRTFISYYWERKE